MNRTTGRHPARRRPVQRALALSAVLALAAAACGGDDGGSADGPTTDTGPPTAGASALPDDTLVFNAQGNNLDAYAAEEPFTAQRVITNAAEDPDGLDLNAQICFFPDGSGRFIAGEDTGQPDPPAGWGLFQLEGAGVGDLRATQVGKLTPTYQPGAQPENYGCGVLSDGRIVTTDLGGQQPGDPGNGQFIVWFGEPEGTDQTYCKVDVELATAQSILVAADDTVYVVSARPPTSGCGGTPTCPPAPTPRGAAGAPTPPAPPSPIG